MNKMSIPGNDEVTGNSRRLFFSWEMLYNLYICKNKRWHSSLYTMLLNPLQLYIHPLQLCGHWAFIIVIKYVTLTIKTACVITAQSARRSWIQSIKAVSHAENGQIAYQTSKFNSENSWLTSSHPRRGCELVSQLFSAQNTTAMSRWRYQPTQGERTPQQQVWGSVANWLYATVNSVTCTCIVE